MRHSINLNGDTREALTHEMLGVAKAASDLIERLNQLTIHMRNYRDGEDFLRDREERRGMVMKAEEVRKWALDEGYRLLGGHE